jgi:signal transduction histidine kinase
MNLLTNAREAISGTGRIHVQSDTIAIEEATASADGLAPGDFVRLRVPDTGEGIRSEVRERIFDPYFTTKSTGQRPGAGLGLSVVRAIVDDHRGLIRVESEFGVGTTFTVLLPALVQNPGDPAPESG